MKKTLRNILLSFMLLFCAAVLFPTQAQADSNRVTNYAQLIDAMKHPEYSWYLAPNEDFGWPSKPVTVELKADSYGSIGLEGNWFIPSNVTIIQSSPMYADGKIYLSGIWKTSKFNPAPMLIRNGGRLILGQSVTFETPLTVNNGGTVDVGSNWLVLTNNTTLTLRKGANVKGMGRICMCGATIYSDGAKLPVTVRASAYTSYGDSNKSPRNQLKGKLTVSNLDFNDDQYFYIPSKSTVYFDGFGIYNYAKNSGLVVEKGGSFIAAGDTTCYANISVNNGGSFTANGFFNLCKGSTLTIHKGGSFVTKGYTQLGEGSTVTILNGGVMSAYKSVMMENKSRINLNGGGKLILNSTGIEVSVKGRQKGYIKGSGTIYRCGYAPYIIDDYKTIASTIKINTSGVKKPVPLVKGKTFVDEGCKYKVTSTGKTVTFLGPVDKNVTNLIIQGGVIYKGVFYQVTTVYKNALSDCKKLTEVFVAGDKLTAVGSNALKGTPKNLVLKVPKQKLSAYKKLFTNKGNTNIKFTTFSY